MKKMCLQPAHPPPFPFLPSPILPLTHSLTLPPSLPYSLPALLPINFCEKKSTAQTAHTLPLFLCMGLGTRRVLLFLSEDLSNVILGTLQRDCIECCNANCSEQETMATSQKHEVFNFQGLAQSTFPFPEVVNKNRYILTRNSYCNK